MSIVSGNGNSGKEIIHIHIYVEKRTSLAVIRMLQMSVLCLRHSVSAVGTSIPGQKIVTKEIREEISVSITAAKENIFA